MTCLFLSGGTRASSSVGFLGLQFQHCAEEPLRGDGQEAHLCVGVQPVQVGALAWQVVIDVLVVGLSTGSGPALAWKYRQRGPKFPATLKTHHHSWGPSQHLPARMEALFKLVSQPSFSLSVSTTGITFAAILHISRGLTLSPYIPLGGRAGTWTRAHLSRANCNVSYLVIQAGRDHKPWSQGHLPIQHLRLDVLAQVRAAQTAVPVVSDVPPVHDLTKEVPKVVPRYLQGEARAGAPERLPRSSPCDRRATE